MNNLSEPLIFTVPLSYTAHAIARQLQQQQSDSQRAKQVYLQALAVYAVNFYLRCLDIETNIQKSDSFNPLYLKFMNVADLWVESLGKLECLPILPGVTVCQVSPEALSDRIGYVAVGLEQSLKQATLLGFTPTATPELPFNQLRSLSELPNYLNQLRQVAKPTQTWVNLSQWFENLFEAGWQELEALLTPKELTPAFNTRSTAESFVRRGKPIQLATQVTQQTVILGIKLSPQSDNSINIVVEVHPIDGQTYLPKALQVKVLDETKTAVMQAIAGDTNQNIQFDFDAEPGEQFSLQLTLENTSAIEEFMV